MNKNYAAWGELRYVESMWLIGRWMFEETWNTKYIYCRSNINEKVQKPWDKRLIGAFFNNCSEFYI